MDTCNIRVARIEDAEALVNIYAPYVTNTAISFEYTVPSVQEFGERMRRVTTKYPYLVAEWQGEIVGYAYADAFKARAAYDWAVETTVYVRQDRKKAGIGKALYEALEKALTLQRILNLNACIAYPEVDDDYLTKNSVQFHAKLGYRLVGEFHHIGFKFDRWYHIVWMEKHIGEHTATPPPVLPFSEIRGELAERYGIV